ncbi:hypothetical protein RvY_16288 [Ramazzottius varieornatus]|uniref:HAT C-terminal dimerisation domain-containing protein n=1 Tax=Ramazzottius varieornatus TaxID=947166 RepID=A0A1D1VXX7_RAMVA|nr:hypothetical protein RvY_16288 [Ramazzottius varieornatus]
MEITAHWVTSELELEELLLGFVSLPAEHSREALKEEVTAVLREYGIAHKTFGWTMDGTANMKAFFNDIKPELQLESKMSEFRLRCVYHVMSNVAEVGVEDDLKIVGRIREMVKFVRKPKAKKQYIALRGSEKDKDKDRHLRLPLDVSTRWNSTLPMLRGAYEARHHLKRYAATYGTTAFKKNLLKDSEWEDVSRLISFLVPLEQATNDCSASRCPTFHLGKQCLSVLHDHFKKPYIKRTAAKMAAKLTSVEPDSWQQKAATVALLLDPCAKTNAFAHPEEKLRAIEVLKKYVGLYSDQSIGIPHSSTVTNSQPASLRDSSLQKITSGLTAQQNEVDSYLGSSAEPKCGVLLWWKSRPAMGFICVVPPLYISELTPSTLRGTVGSIPMMQVAHELTRNQRLDMD